MFADLVGEGRLGDGKMVDVSDELAFCDFFRWLVELVYLPLDAKRQDGI